MPATYVVAGNPQHTTQAVTEAVLVSGIDFALGETATVTLTANRNMGAPLNPLPGQRGRLVVTQDTTGGRVLTLPSAFSIANLQINLTPSSRTEIPVEYDGTVSKWVLAPGYIPPGYPVHLAIFGPDPTGVNPSTAAWNAAKAACATTGARLIIEPGTYLLDDLVLFQGFTNLTVMAWGATIKPTASTQWGTTGGKRFVLQFNDCPGLKVFGLNGDGNGAAELSAPTTGWWSVLGVTSTGTPRDLGSTYITIDALLQDVTIKNYRALAIRGNRINGLKLKRVNVYQGFNNAGANNGWDAVSLTKVDRLKIDDCDMDGGSNSDSSHGTIGNVVGVSPGNGFNDDPTQAINNCDVINYNRLSQFIAPPASSAVSTVQVSYGTIATPSSAPVTSDGGVAGSLTGTTYTVAYTLLNSAGETLKSPDSTGLVLVAGHQITVAALTGLPTGVWGVKFYITNATDKGLVTIAGSTIVPVVAGATAAVNITAPGDGSNTPASNTTAATEVYGGGDLDYLGKNTWYFFGVTPGTGTNSGIIPSNQIKVTAVDQTNKLITFERHDTSEGGTVMNWAGQQIYFMSINLNMFCDHIRIRNSRFDNSGTSGGVFLLGCKDFVYYKNRATSNVDVALDAEWCIEGEFDGNRIDCMTRGNTAIGVLFLSRDIQITRNRMKGVNNQAILYHTGYQISSGITASGNISRGGSLQFGASTGQGWDSITEDLIISENTVLGGYVTGGVPALRSGLISVGVQDNATGKLGRYRGVAIVDNILDGCSQRALFWCGIEGMSIMRNHFRNTGYDAMYESNSVVSSLNVSVEDNFFSNIGTRGQGSFGIYRSAGPVTATSAPFIGRQFWHNVDSGWDKNQHWYRPNGAITHPVGGDYLAVGPSMLRHLQGAGGQLQVSVDTTTGGNNTWAPIRRGGQQAVTLGGGTVTIDMTAGETIIAALNASTTIAFSNEIQGTEVTIEVNHDATASVYVATWPANVKFAGGAFGTSKGGTQTANSKDTVTLVRDATNWVEKSRALALA